MLITKKINNIDEDIKNILKDVELNTEFEYKNYNQLEELTEYIIEILKNIYNKKLLSPEIIIQYCYFYFRNSVLDNLYPFEVNLELNKKIYDNLVKENENSPPQKSQQWYLYRYNRVTASDIASIFGKSAFTSRKELINSKCRDFKNTSYITNKYMDHGNKYEICATWFYEFITQSKSKEFGCLPHPSVDFLGASPDGITDEGVMIEIKCPLSRTILGIPPIYYWYQIQIQLEVANLSRCDYIECNFKEKSREEFYQITTEKKVERAIEVGFIIEYIDDTKDKKCYEYFPYKERINKFSDWETKKIDEILKKNNTYVKTIYWILEEYGLCPIYRDIRWYYKNFNIINDFWEEVLYLRKNPKEIVKSNPNIKISNISTKYLLIDSDEDS